MFTFRNLLAIVAIVVLISLTPQAEAGENAAPTPTFTILTAPNQDYPRVKLGDTISVRLAGVNTDMTKANVSLRIDGELADLTHRWFPDSQTLQFQLERNDANKSFWSRELGAPFGRARIVQLSIDVEINGQALAYKQDARNDSQALSGDILLVRYNELSLITGFLAVICVIGILIVCCYKTTIMRDSVIPQLLIHERSYSLARFQMVFWFIIILASFLFILLITQSFHSLTTESFALLGIPAVTTVTAMAVDQSKNDLFSRIEIDLAGMGIATAEDVQKLYMATNVPGAGTAAARPTIPNATLPGNPNPSFLLLRQAYDREIIAIKSAGFWKDLVNDLNGPTVHRWQMFIWTIVVGLIFAWRSYTDLTMPVLGNELLTLMGVSSAAYVGIKIPERQI